jgi:hypothetical protein
MKAKNYIIIGGAIALFLLWQKNKTTKLSTSTIAEGETATTETSQATSTSSEPEQVFGMGLPSGMDLPILTAGTGVPTEVAVQQGGVVTTPTPAIVSSPILSIEESLQFGGIIPMVKPFKPYSPIYETTELPNATPNIGLATAPTFELSENSPIVVMPRVKPSLYMADF